MASHVHVAGSLGIIGMGVLLAFPVEPQKKPPLKPDDNQAIRLEVEMVSLPVVVTTREGKRITDLKKDDFQVFEDGVPQTIAGFAATDEPISVVLALDTSGSTELGSIWHTIPIVAGLSLVQRP